jgi:hypothetical protein
MWQSGRRYVLGKYEHPLWTNLSHKIGLAYILVLIIKILNPMTEELILIFVLTAL